MLAQNSNAKITIRLKKIQLGKTRNSRKPKNGYIRKNVDIPFLKSNKKRAKQEYMPFYKANAQILFMAKTYNIEVNAC